MSLPAITWSPASPESLPQRRSAATIPFPARQPDRPARVLLAGGHSISRDSLRALLRTSSRIRVLAEASGADDAMQLALRHRPDIVLLDLPIPGCKGLHFIRNLCARWSGVQILLLASLLDEREIVSAIQAGARGVVLRKSATTQTLFSAIRSVCAGHYWIGQQEAMNLVDVLHRLAPAPPAVVQHPFGLTSRELEILPLVAGGYSNVEIARTLAISIQTVKHHVSHIFDKLGVFNRLELTLFAMHHKLIESQMLRARKPPESSQPQYSSLQATGHS